MDPGLARDPRRRRSGRVAGAGIGLRDPKGAAVQALYGFLNGAAIERLTRILECPTAGVDAPERVADGGVAGRSARRESAE